VPHPVKSLRTGRIERPALDAHNLEGDPRFAIVDVVTGYGLTGPCDSELLFATARVR
jgi:uncharacterized protein YcbX